MKVGGQHVFFGREFSASMFLIFCNSYCQTIRTLSLFIFPFFSLGMLVCHCYDPPETYAQYKQFCIICVISCLQAKNLNSSYRLDASIAKDTRFFGWAPVLGQAKPRQAPAKSSTFNCISVPNITIQCMRRLLILKKRISDTVYDKNDILYLFVWPTIGPAMLGGSPSMTLPRRRKVN